MMLFTNERERESFFAEYEKNPHKCCYGSALEHAASTNIGIWGDRNALMKDVARVMAIEVNRYREENGMRYKKPITTEEVMRCDSFVQCFNHARCETENEMEAALGSLIKGYKPNVKEVKAPPTPAHVLVSEEATYRRRR